MSRIILTAGFAMLLTFSFLSCEKKIDFNANKPSPKLVLYANMDLDSNIQAHLSHTQFILDKQKYIDELSIEDGKLSLYKNNQFVSDFTQKGKGFYQHSSKMEAGSVYKITASSGSYKNVEAEIKIPEKVQILKVDTATVYRKQEYDITATPHLKVSISFKDKENQKNYYQLKIKEYEVGFWRDSYFETDEVSFEENPFSDVAFDGKNYSIHFYVRLFPNYDQSSPNKYSTTKLQIIFSHISESYYLYQKTKDKANEEDFLSEKTTVYSNVKNGTGVITSQAIYQEIIDIK